MRRHWTAHKTNAFSRSWSVCAHFEDLQISKKRHRSQLRRKNAKFISCPERTGPVQLFTVTVKDRGRQWPRALANCRPHCTWPICPTAHLAARNRKNATDIHSTFNSPTGRKQLGDTGRRSFFFELSQGEPLHQQVASSPAHCDKQLLLWLSRHGRRGAHHSSIPYVSQRNRKSLTWATTIAQALQEMIQRPSCATQWYRCTNQGIFECCHVGTVTGTPNCRIRHRRQSNLWVIKLLLVQNMFRNEHM